MNNQFWSVGLSVCAMIVVARIAVAQLGELNNHSVCVERNPCAGPNDGAPPKCMSSGACNWCDGAGLRNEECVLLPLHSCTWNGPIADCGVNHLGFCEKVDGEWQCVDYGMISPCYRYDCESPLQ